MVKFGKGKRMKKIFALVLFMSITSNAYSMRGRGSLEGELLISTLKSSSYTSEGITSGFTSMTTQKSGKSMSEKKKVLNKFIAENHKNLAIDIAKGSGESIDALAELAEINNEKKQIFYSKLKSKFDTIFPSGKFDHKYTSKQINIIIDENIEDKKRGTRDSNGLPI